jgi:hypothetical protein
MRNFILTTTTILLAFANTFVIAHPGLTDAFKKKASIGPWTFGAKCAFVAKPTEEQLYLLAKIATIFLRVGLKKDIV